MTGNVAQLLDIEYGPNSVRFDPERPLVIAPNLAAFQKIKNMVPSDYEIFYAGIDRIGVARSAIAGRKCVHIFEDGDKIWRDATEVMVSSVNGCIRPLPPMLDIIRGDQIVIEPIRWLWKGWLARGKLHILAGPAGTGKTTIALNLATTITNGGYFPDQTRAQSGDVIIWSGEDDTNDTLAPRMKAAGADMARVHFIRGVTDEDGHRSFDPAMDVPALVDVMRVIRPALLIIDPIVSAVAGDSHKNAETRRALQPLVDMAVKLDVALLGITHFSKGTAGRDPTERVTGSLAFGAIARVVMVAVKCKKEGGGGPILCRSKSNIGPDGDGFTYELEQQSVSDVSGIIASCISWREAVYGTATELLADAETADKDGGLLAEAKEFLEAELADGPVAASAMTAAVKQAAHSAATIRRAKKELGIISKKVGIKGGWCWVISPKVLKIPEDAHHNNLSAFDDNEHVQDNGVKAWKAEI